MCCGVWFGPKNITQSPKLHVEADAEQQTPSVLVAELIDLIRTQFYGDANKYPQIFDDEQVRRRTANVARLEIGVARLSDHRPGMVPAPAPPPARICPHGAAWRPTQNV